MQPLDTGDHHFPHHVRSGSIVTTNVVSFPVSHLRKFFLSGTLPQIAYHMLDLTHIDVKPATV